ncbi:MAG TPA: erythromycin esterase family protein [Chloroflexia bacterium]
MRKQLLPIVLCACLVMAASGCGPASRRHNASRTTPTSSIAAGTTTPHATNAPTFVPLTPSAATGASTTTPSPGASSKGDLDTVRRAAHPIAGVAGDYDPLMSLVGDARFVLLGEASHGTHDFYRERARITRRLIEEKGFTAIAVEGEWQDAYRVNRYVRGFGDERDAESALSGFVGFPEWMWNNTDVRDLAEWLKQHNAALPPGASPVGFYGLDMYGIKESADAVAEYFDKRDPTAARQVRDRYSCLSRTEFDPADYESPADTPNASCNTRIQEQVTQLQQMLERAEREGYTGDRVVEREELFSALRNAVVVKSKREYDRSVSTGPDSSWNVRDRHMAGTLEALSAHLGAGGKPAKVVVWAHNTHVGDARATEMAESEELDLGQLAREKYKEDAVLVGFTTYTGTVIAARSWDEPGQQFDVRPALPESYSGLFHDAGVGNALFILRGNERLAEALDEPRLQRGIGVLYLPETERPSHYYQAWLSRQFDAVIHIEVSSAVTPLKAAERP